MRKAEIKVPSSSANIGPGFDVLGIALSLYLTVTVTVGAEGVTAPPGGALITASGAGSEDIPLQTDANLITRTALYVLRANDVRMFPANTSIHIHNDIPLGRGLGSSGAAVVAGVMLGDYVGNLKLDKSRLLDFCLMIERHPDNIAASIYGGFVGSFLRELNSAELAHVEIPIAEVLQTQGGVDTGMRPPSPPQDLARSLKYGLAPELKAVCVIPQFEVSTALSRDVLPGAYTREDAIYNLQRVALLTSALAQSPPDAGLVYLAMQDRLHQRYRRVLVPGLAHILTSITPKTHDGLLGVCLSGAGPTVLALATHNFEEIANSIVESFKAHDVVCTWKLLEPAEGAHVNEL